MQALLTMRCRDKTDPRIGSFGQLLYEEAVIAEGSRLRDPSAFIRRLNELLLRDATGETKRAREDEKPDS